MDASPAAPRSPTSPRSWPVPAAPGGVRRPASDHVRPTGRRVVTAALRLGTRAQPARAHPERARGRRAARQQRPRRRAGRDHDPRRPLRRAAHQIGGTGVFVSALREALLAAQVDLAVHSLKDLPTARRRRHRARGRPDAGGPPRRAGRPRRADPRRARRRVAVVGTGSPRRAAQLRALGLGLEVVAVRGNVDTRLRMVSSGTLDAVVLARAGLLRIGRADEATEVLDPIQVLPAPGQGALAVECRADDAATLARARGSRRPCHAGPAWWPSAPCSPPSRAAAPRRWVPWPTVGPTRAAAPAPSCTCAPWPWSPPTARLDLRRSTTGPPTTPRGSAAGWPGAARGRRRRPGAAPRTAWTARSRRTQPDAPPDAPPGARPGPPDARPDAPPGAVPAAGEDASGQEQTFARRFSSAGE